MKPARLITVVLVSVLALASCTSGTDAISVGDPWGRTSPQAAANAAFYMTLTGGDTDDTLVAAETDACGVVELHETVMNDGVMKMQHLPDGVTITSGAVVVFEPGGIHVMCIDKQVEFSAGDNASITLVFETAGPMIVDFEIRDQ